MTVFLLVILAFAVITTHYGGCSGATFTVACARYRQRHFYGTANRVILGHGYHNVTGVSRQRCAQHCLVDARCLSINFWGGSSRRCELNEDTAENCPLMHSPGAYYYRPTEKINQSPEFGETGLPVLTNRTYDNQASASDECQAADQHLCELWEVHGAYAAGCVGILPDDTDMWYAVPDSQAVVTGSEVSQHGLPMNVPSSGICCPGSQLSPQNPIITPIKYAKDDVAGQKRACAELASHPCMLPELKAAYLRGYRQPSSTFVEGWFLFAIRRRDAQLFSDGCSVDYRNNPAECYEDIVANTPRPYPFMKVICCQNLY